jgi:hypothetical protein
MEMARKRVRLLQACQNVAHEATKTNFPQVEKSWNYLMAGEKKYFLDL